MQFKEHKQAEVLTTAGEDSIEMGIDLSDKKFIMGLFAEGIYKDNIGSIVREATSNGVDAVREADNEEPVVVSLTMNDKYQYSFKVTDFGSGISPERMNDVVSKYFASTKRVSDKFIGGFGLGMKAPLSLRDSFTITTVYDRVRYKYLMYKSEEGVAIDLLHQEDTTDRNGTQIEIILKDWSERNAFESKICEQLAYFERVYFNVDCIDNEFKIIKHEDWKYSELASSSMMHLCLDNCYYAIDYAKLGIDTIYCPIALNFDLGGDIIPVPSREDIKYTPAAKQAIKDKIKKVAEYFVNLYNTAISSKSHVFDVWDKLDKKTKEVEVEGITFSIGDLVPHSSIAPSEPSVEGITKIDLKRFVEKSEHILYYFDYKAHVEHRGRGYISSTKGHADPKNIINLLRVNKTVILATGDAIPKLKMDYIKDTIGYCTIVRRTTQKRPLKTKGLKSSFYNLLKLNEVPKEEWRETIRQYQILEDSIVAKMIKLEDITPSEHWLEERKKNKKRSAITIVQKIEVNPKWGELMDMTRGGYSYKYVTDTPVEISNVESGVVVWGTVDDRDKLDTLNVIFDSKLKTCILTQRDIDRVISNNIKDWFNIHSFMSSRHPLFAKFCTAFKLAEFKEQDENKIYFNNIDFVVDIDAVLGKNLIEIRNYISANYKTYSGKYELAQEMTTIAEESGMIDQTMIDLLEEVKKDVVHLSFLEHLKKTDGYGSGREIHKECLPLAIEIYNTRKSQVYAEA